MLRDFLKHCDLDSLAKETATAEELSDAINDEKYQQAFGHFVDEIFHILFLNVTFLRNFNLLTAGHILDFGGFTDDARFTSNSRLKRVRVPKFAKDAVYYRDQGRCRSCKKPIDRLLSPNEVERYDHLVPLSKGGANDVSNLQLLCDACNSKKSDSHSDVSNLYGRIYRVE